jgi:hypothetical protein
MRFLNIVAFIAVSCLLFACNNDEGNNLLSANNSSLAQGQRDTASPNTSSPNAITPQDSINQQDNSNTSEPEGDAIPDDDSSNTQNANCTTIDNAEPLFISDLGNYYVPIETETHDYTAAQTSWTKSIRSADDADEFVQTYKIGNAVKNKLLAIDYSQYTVDAVYIGFRSVCGYKYSLSQVCKDNSITLDVISAPAMDDAISHPVVFIQLPSQHDTVNIAINDTEVSFEEYSEYPAIEEI